MRHQNITDTTGTALTGRRGDGMNWSYLFAVEMLDELDLILKWLDEVTE